MKLSEIFKNPLMILIYLERIKIIKLNDEWYLKILFKRKMKKNLNLKEPLTFNEKLQWLKLYDRNAEYIKMVDKYDAKKYVSDIIGSEYIIPTLGIYSKFEEINFAELPERFVIKCTHDSGGVIICKDKENFDTESARKKINKLLKKNFFYAGREWPYKEIQPRIIVEKYMSDNINDDLIDYKFLCFNGKVKYIFT